MDCLVHVTGEIKLKDPVSNLQAQYFHTSLNSSKIGQEDPFGSQVDISHTGTGSPSGFCYLKQASAALLFWWTVKDCVTI